jgi:hypothetical protein
MGYLTSLSLSKFIIRHKLVVAFEEWSNSLSVDLNIQSLILRAEIFGGE